MSNVHAYADACDCGVSEFARTHYHPIEELCHFAAALARGLIATLQHRRAVRRMERFSDHLLEDMGFARHWDGSITRRAR